MNEISRPTAKEARRIRRLYWSRKNPENQTTLSLDPLVVERINQHLQETLELDGQVIIISWSQDNHRTLLLTKSSLLDYNEPFPNREDNDFSTRVLPFGVFDKDISVEILANGKVVDGALAAMPGETLAILAKDHRGLRVIVDYPGTQKFRKSYCLVNPAFLEN